MAILTNQAGPNTKFKSRQFFDCPFGAKLPDLMPFNISAYTVIWSNYVQFNVHALHHNGESLYPVKKQRYIYI